MPKPLDYDTLEDNSPTDMSPPPPTTTTTTTTAGLEEQKVWSVKENFEMFKKSVVRLATRYLKERETQPDAILSLIKTMLMLWIS